MRRITDIFHTAAVQMAVIVGLAMVALLTCGCRRMPDERLVHAQSIMEEHPDSALRLLEELNLPENAGEHDRALHALLLTHARYKNYITDSGDSLIRIAAEYFGKHGPAEEASKALFLLGKIQMNAKRYGEAAVSLSRGLDIAEQSGSLFWEGRCADGLCKLYDNLLNSSAQLKYARIAYDAFSEGGYDDWANWSKMSIATAYNNNKQYLLADSIATELCIEAKERDDTALLEEASHLKGLASFNAEDYSQSIEAYCSAYLLNPCIITTADKRIMHVAKSKVTLDSIPSHLRNVLEEILSSSGSQPPFSYLAEQGEYEEAYHELNRYRIYQDSVLSEILHNNVSESVYEYELVKEIIKKGQTEKERILWVSSILIALCICMIIVLGYRLQIQKKNEKISELADNLESLQSDFQKQLKKIEQSGRTTIGAKYVQILRGKYSAINALCDDYYQDSCKKSSAGKINSEMEKILSDFSNPEFIRSIEEYVDSVSGNLYSDFRKDLYMKSHDNHLLFLYYLIGFSPRTIAVLLGQNTSAIYNKKSRLSAAVEAIQSPRQEEYLRIIPGKNHTGNPTDRSPKA